MARPTVPHCVDCKFYCDVRSHRDCYASHRCFYFGSDYMARRLISGQEIRTSPLWCPLRRAGFRKAFGRQLQEDAKTPRR